MAFILCPECRKNISETAKACPKCGCGLTPEIVAAQKKKNEVDIFSFVCLGISGVIFSVIVVGCCVMFKDIQARSDAEVQAVLSGGRTAPRYSTPSNSGEEFMQRLQRGVGKGASWDDVDEYIMDDRMGLSPAQKAAYQRGRAGALRDLEYGTP